MKISVAQDYQISFSAYGAVSVIDSITVENLIQRTSLTIQGTDVLHLSGTYGRDLSAVDPQPLKIFPNPLNESSILEFDNPKRSLTRIRIHDESGHLISKAEFLCHPGKQRFKLPGLPAGFYTLTVSSGSLQYSSGLLSMGVSKNLSRIRIEAAGDDETKPPALKNSNILIPMQYNDGELLVFKAYSGNYIRVQVLVPVQSQEISFEFISCTDADGNNYPVVSIGTQTWMGENLRTTHFSNGISIPEVADNYAWKTAAGGAFCWPMNDPGNKVKYGALYNGFAVNDTSHLCPVGWHLPDDSEWDILGSFLGTTYPGGKLKSTRTDPFYEQPRWDSPNIDATNESGFAGLPAGYRYYDDGLMGVGVMGLWWSSSVQDNIANWTRNLMIGNGDLDRSLWTWGNGLSVRCVKD